MNFKSNDKKINQYMLHAELVEDHGDGLVEFKRHVEKGFAIFKDGVVVELFVRPGREFKEFKNDREIEDIKKELNDEWLINKI